MSEIDWDQDESVAIPAQRPVAVFAGKEDVMLEFPAEEWERENGGSSTHSVVIKLGNIEMLCRALRAAKRDVLDEKKRRPNAVR